MLKRGFPSAACCKYLRSLELASLLPASVRGSTGFSVSAELEGFASLAEAGACVSLHLK